MAENEKLDVGYRNSGRWRKLASAIDAGKSVTEVGKESVRCVTQTLNRLRKLFEQNGVPLENVIKAASADLDDKEKEEIFGCGHYGRDYLQLLESQTGQGLDEQTIVENFCILIIDRFLSQIGQDVIGTDRYPDASIYREFGIRVKESMLGDLQKLAKRLVANPETPLRCPPRSASQKAEMQDDLLKMSIGIGREISE